MLKQKHAFFASDQSADFAPGPYAVRVADDARRRFGRSRRCLLRCRSAFPGVSLNHDAAARGATQ